ncbi:MAG: helix-turn-helix transcriptional regulator [Clostridia bacterium]|nr:helix-turn-helix transcriptional regulator [Clostridia bacterium]
MTLTESLKKIRKQYKMTQEEVAQFLGISRSGYTYYETGKTVPSIEMLKKLATMYDTTIDNVVGMPQEKNVSGRAVSETGYISEGLDPLMYMKKEEKNLIMAFRLLSEEEKKKITNDAIAMLSKKEEQC